jgi:molybdopterin-containing oxidoreductase family membrane subunit
MSTDSENYAIEKPLIENNPTFSSLTEEISGITERKTPKVWFLAIGASLSLLMVLFGSIGFLFYEVRHLWRSKNSIADISVPA